MGPRCALAVGTHPRSTAIGPTPGPETVTADLSSIRYRGNVEVIPIRWVEPSSPAPSHRFPPGPEGAPHARRGDGGRGSSNPQISRQSRTREMEGRGGSLLSERTLHRPLPMSRDDVKAWPTKPAGGKLFIRPRVQTLQHIHHSWVQSPSSRQITATCSRDTFGSHLGGAMRS